jgi:hypothetical protein
MLFYDDTNAESVGTENLSNHPLQTLEIDLRTSHTYLAGTNDTVYITFVGDFSVSGPHDLAQNFTAGQISNIQVPLDRRIGELKNVLLHKDGTDGYLWSSMRVRIKDVIYEMTGPRQWLDNQDATTEALYPDSNGFEPNSQQTTDEVPVGASLTLSVLNTLYYYDSTGLYESW